MKAFTLVRALAVAFAMAVALSPAAEVPAPQARLAAAAWRASRSPFGARLGRTPASVRTVRPAATADAEFHVVRFETGGFAVMSADDDAEPVVAFSEGDDLVESDLNPLWRLLKAEAAAASGRRRSHAARSRWRALLAPSPIRNAAGASARQRVDDLRVAPLVASAWDQTTDDWNRNCYNYSTPGHYPCGCVATAAGQVMRYFEWPRSSMPRYANPYCTVNGSQRSFTTEGGVYDWVKMTLKPDSTATEEANRAEIGKLLSDIGIALGMNYGPYGSGAFNWILKEVFEDHFGYTNAMAYDNYRQNIDEETIVNAILANLDARLPVVLSIAEVDGDYASGHSIVGDGYGYIDDTLYLHLNFGWSGQADAWYAPPDLNTGGYQFNVLNGCVYNIYTDAVKGALIASGRVTAPDGTARAGVTMTATSAETAREVARTVTDEHGIYSFILPAGDYIATAAADGLAVTRPISLRPCVPVGLPTGRNAYLRFYGYTEDSVRQTVGNRAREDIVLTDMAQPVITAFAPAAATVPAQIGERLAFSLSAYDPAGAEVSYEWVLDGVTVATGPAYVREIGDYDTGERRLTCYVSTPEWSRAVSHVWRIVIANAYCVDASGGSDRDGDGSAARPFATIDRAIKVSSAGDMIRVRPGVYASVVAPEHGVSIVAVEGPEVTVIDGMNAASCYSDPTGNSLLSGFTLEYGYADYGGGACGGVITNCVVCNCSAEFGAIYNTVAADSIIRDNTCDYGGGASMSTLVRCTVYHNWSNLVGSGAGVDCDSLLDSSIVWDNWDYDGEINNWERLETESGEVWTPSFYNSCTTPGGFFDGGGNILADPEFVDPDTDDIRLLRSSPCLGSGAGGANMGWYQGPGIGDWHCYCVDAVRGNDANDGLSWERPKRSIAAAVAAARAGDEVEVKPGVYAPFTTSCRLAIRALSPGVCVDGQGRERCFADEYGSTLMGFTLRGGFADVGGGAHGGTLVGCVISNCVAGAGGGVAEAEVVSSLIVRNRARITNGPGRGGGAYNATLVSCTLTDNHAEERGGGAFFGDRFAMNSIIVGNFGVGGSSNVAYSASGYAYNSIIAESPGFADAAGGDWHLSALSPAIDAADDDYLKGDEDLEGHARIYGARSDLGCYEYDYVPALWAVPAVEPGASAEDEAMAVGAAMAANGFSPEAAAAVTRMTEYNRLTAWAGARGVTVAAAAASPVFFLSAATGADGLLALESGDFTVTALEPTDKGWRLELAVAGADPRTADPLLLPLALSATGAAAVNGVYRPDFFVSQTAGGGAAFTVEVTPPAGPRMFMKGKVR